MFAGAGETAAAATAESGKSTTAAAAAAKSARAALTAGGEAGDRAVTAVASCGPSQAFAARLWVRAAAAAAGNHQLRGAWPDHEGSAAAAGAVLAGRAPSAADVDAQHFARGQAEVAADLSATAADDVSVTPALRQK